MTGYGGILVRDPLLASRAGVWLLPALSDGAGHLEGRRRGGPNGRGRGRREGAEGGSK